MRYETPSTPWAVMLGLLLVGALLLAPAAWASGEDVREQGVAAQSSKKDSVPKAKSDADEKTDETAARPKVEQPAVDESFNTVEEIVAHLGSLDSLWSAKADADAAPRVTWRETSGS